MPYIIYRHTSKQNNPKGETRAGAKHVLVLTSPCKQMCRFKKWNFTRIW